VARLYPQALGHFSKLSRLSRNDSWSSLYNLGTDCTENSASIIACSVVAVETSRQSRSLPTAVILSPVYTAVTWQWVYMPQYSKWFFREIGWSRMDWIDLTQDMDQWSVLLNTVKNLQVPWNVCKFLSRWATGGFSRRTQCVTHNLLVWIWSQCCKMPMFALPEMTICISRNTKIYLLNCILYITFRGHAVA
jgi:hypothetical protein